MIISLSPGILDDLLCFSFRLSLFDLVGCMAFFHGYGQIPSESIRGDSFMILEDVVNLYGYITSA